MNMDWEMFQHCCGVREFGAFRRSDYGHSCSKNRLQGAAYGVATFIDTNVCYVAYEELKESHELVFQSEPKMNPQSGNMLFICVYKEKE